MNPRNVLPARWFNSNYPIRLLYEDDECSIIWGTFDEILALGTRWNGTAREVGYPRQGPHPLWYVEPDIIAIGILNYLQTLRVNGDTFISREDIEIAIRELTEKMNS